VNAEFQRYTLNLNYLDSLARVRKKEAAEEKLRHLEDMIRQLSRSHVFVQH